MIRPDFIRSSLSVAEVNDLRATIAELRDAAKGAAVIANHAGGKIRELAAEVARLKAIDDERHERVCADMGRRVSVENELLLLATGKRDPIEPEEARRLALKLGVPEWFNEMEVERAAPAAISAPVAEMHRCFICSEPFRGGELVLMDREEGLGHRACFGEDREGYCNLDTGDPLGADEPIPAGEPYDPADYPEYPALAAARDQFLEGQIAGLERAAEIVRGKPYGTHSRTWDHQPPDEHGNRGNSSDESYEVRLVDKLADQIEAEARPQPGVGGNYGYSHDPHDQSSDDAAPPAAPDRFRERVKRLQEAAEGELDGLAIDDATAAVILAYVDGDDDAPNRARDDGIPDAAPR